MFSQTIEAMNTRLGFVLWDFTEHDYPAVFLDIQKTVIELEKTISRYDDGAELFMLNQTGFDHEMKVSAQLWQAVKAGISYYHLSNGYFNVAMGNFYHAHKNQLKPTPTTQESIENLIICNDADKSIRFSHPSASIDFGGMGKGLALKAIGTVLEKFDISNAFVTFGESSILTKGRHPHGEWWPFALSDSYGVDKQWKMNDCSISISHTFRNDNISHIVDPVHQKTISERKLSLVQATDPVDAEVLSTTLLIAPPTEHQAIIERFDIDDYLLIEK